MRCMTRNSCTREFVCSTGARCTAMARLKSISAAEQNLCMNSSSSRNVGVSEMYVASGSSKATSDSMASLTNEKPRSAMSTGLASMPRARRNELTSAKNWRSAGSCSITSRSSLASSALRGTTVTWNAGVPSTYVNSSVLAICAFVFSQWRMLRSDDDDDESTMMYEQSTSSVVPTPSASNAARGVCASHCSSDRPKYDAATRAIAGCRVAMAAVTLLCVTLR
mmetsp:Transcript_11018/g.26604  ORF Transcript_11018/g.26604 Transcript_11018/m.26604 type:complete len:223 (-) Transcript_11018:408-1076(-)